MGKLNIQGDLDIYNYLTASNTNLYLSSASTSYSLRFRAGTTEFLRGQISTSTNGTTHGTITGLYLFGPTYGNTTANIATAGKLSIGDPGPQIIFNSYASLSDGQPLALIYSDNDSIASGNSLSLVSSESNCTFIAPTIKALTKFIGTLDGNASTATKLKTARTISLTGSVTGSGSFDGSGNLSIATTTNHTHSYLPLSGGTLTGAITLPGKRYYASGNKYGLNCQNSDIVEANGIYFGDLVDGGGEGINFSRDSSTWDTLYAKSGGLYFHPNRAMETTPNGYAILHSNNYTSYTVTKTGSGASGTWGINVTGSAGSVAWKNVTGKPSKFTPASHTHSYVPLSGGTMTGTLDIKGSGSDRATLAVFSSSNIPCDLWLGSNNLTKWSITCRASDENYMLGLYNKDNNYSLHIKPTGEIIFDKPGYQYGSSFPSGPTKGQIFFKT